MISTAFWKFNSFSIVVTVFHSHIFVELENQHDHWWRLRPSYSRLTTLQMIFTVPHKALKILLREGFQKKNVKLGLLAEPSMTPPPPS